LAHEGFIVFASVRSGADADRLAALHARVRPILFDVTKRDEITAAAAIVSASNAPLLGLVNNAGIAVPGPLEFLPIEELRKQFEVNVFGALAVTQAFLPQLREVPGRVVFMSSVSGQIAAPFVGAYSASKFALEAIADALRIEMRPFGVNVSVIQPGNVKTPIWGKGRAQRQVLSEQMPPQAHAAYGASMERLVEVTLESERSAIEAGEVARAVHGALSARRPRARYAVGSPAAWQRRFATLLPERWRDRMIAGQFLKNSARDGL